ncbi:hypothetical protein [Galactobacter valiniphilus]|uniref:hypothetical protein n=1 Tax=Galactobacter valiniphilus TaxID=2676122 RepID=UPI003735557E
MREKTDPTPEATAAFEALVAELAGAGVVEGSMFGTRALTMGGKALGCLSGDELAVKLRRDTAELEAALALEGAVLFDPSGKGRPFKDWVLVPGSVRETWPALLEDALRFANS